MSIIPTLEIRDLRVVAGGHPAAAGVLLAPVVGLVGLAVVVASVRER